jgi:hypothetical protein
MNSESVLKRLLQKKTQTEMVETFLKPEKATAKKKPNKPGRPKIEASKKARNFTLCLAPKFVEFIDKMIVKDPKIQGRGRKIRFIIERFIEHEKRSLHHMKVIRESLLNVQNVLQGFGGRVKKGQKLDLSIKEKVEITKAVDQVQTLLRLLNYSPKVLHRNLPPGEWALLSFCLNWQNNRGVVI